MKKDNIFNKIFFKRTLKEEKEKYEKCKSLVGHFPELDERISASKSLEEILELHKKAWGLGYQNSNLAPCEWGMFRTRDISKMTPDEVYLGNIYGLWTFPIPEWEKEENKNQYIDSASVYDIILNQYKRILHSNLSAICTEARSIIRVYEKINHPSDGFKLK